MAMHGFDSTVHADIPLMKPHIEAVARGDKFIVGDMPFLSCSRGLAAAIDGAQTLIEAGSMAIKIERHTHQVDIIDHIVDAGVPVIGHIGLPPRVVHSLGGHKVQGRNEGKAHTNSASPDLMSTT